MEIQCQDASFPNLTVCVISHLSTIEVVRVEKLGEKQLLQPDEIASIGIQDKVAAVILHDHSCASRENVLVLPLYAPQRLIGIKVIVMTVIEVGHRAHIQISGNAEEIIKFEMELQLVIFSLILIQVSTLVTNSPKIQGERLGSQLVVPSLPVIRHEIVSTKSYLEEALDTGVEEKRYVARHQQRIRRIPLVDS